MTCCGEHVNARYGKLRLDRERKDVMRIERENNKMTEKLL
jgi:hypothetical protein